jgi:hypothetical protein
MVTLAEADLVVSAWAMAMTATTVPGLDIVAGAVYRPEVDIVPTVALPPITPPANHVTAVFVVPETVAVYWNVLPTLKDVGTVPNAMVTPGGVEEVVGTIPTLWQPTISISTLKLIPKIHDSRRRPRIIDPAPIKPEFRFDSIRSAPSAPIVIHLFMIPTCGSLKSTMHRNPGPALFNACRRSNGDTPSEKDCQVKSSLTRAFQADVEVHGRNNFTIGID